MSMRIRPTARSSCVNIQNKAVALQERSHPQALSTIAQHRVHSHGESVSNAPVPQSAFGSGVCLRGPARICYSSSA
jgi:hypothetical protein